MNICLRSAKGKSDSSVLSITQCKPFRRRHFLASVPCQKQLCSARLPVAFPLYKLIHWQNTWIRYQELDMTFPVTIRGEMHTRSTWVVLREIHHLRGPGLGHGLRGARMSWLRPGSPYVQSIPDVKRMITSSLPSERLTMRLS